MISRPFNILNENMAFIRVLSEPAVFKYVTLLMKENMSDTVYTLNAIFDTLVSDGIYVDLITLLLEDRRINVVSHFDAFSLACYQGHEEVVKLLLQDKRINPAESANCALQQACFNGHLKVVEMLLLDTRVNPSDCGNYALQNACRGGYTKVVELLLSQLKRTRVDPTQCGAYLIKTACDKSHLEILELLIQDDRIDVSFDDNYLLFHALTNNWLKIVKLLIPRLTEYRKINPSLIETCEQFLTQYELFNAL